MGKVSLFIAASAMTLGLLSYTSLQVSSYDTQELNATYQQEVLSEQISKAGLEASVSHVKRSFSDWRAGFDNIGYQGGNLDVSLSGSAAGPVTVTSTGTYSGASHVISTTLSRLAQMPAALTLNVDTAALDLQGSNFTVSGIDTSPVSTPHQQVDEGNGRGSSVRALSTNSEGFAEALVGDDGFLEEMLGDVELQFRGIDDEGDVEYASELSHDYEAVVNEAIDEADTIYDTDQTFTADDEVGTSTEPAIIVVYGNVTLTETFEGHGLLVVYGDFTAEDFSSWNGVVMVYGPEDANAWVTMADNARIFGNLFVEENRGLQSEEEVEEEEEDECDYASGGSGPVKGNHSNPENSKKILICHFPPGNPENVQTISISKNAWRPHRDHHNDYDGPCLCGPSDDAEEEEEAQTPNPIFVSLQDNAGIYHSSETIGKLAARITSIEEAAWIINYNQYAAKK